VGFVGWANGQLNKSVVFTRVLFGNELFLSKQVGSVPCSLLEIVAIFKRMELGPVRDLGLSNFHSLLCRLRNSNTQV